MLQGLVGVGRELRLDGFEIQTQAGEQRAETVVEVSSEAAAFLLPRLDQGSAGHQGADTTPARDRIA